LLHGQRLRRHGGGDHAPGCGGARDRGAGLEDDSGQPQSRGRDAGWWSMFDGAPTVDSQN
jgi:hypothetical protein